MAHVDENLAIVLRQSFDAQALALENKPICALTTKRRTRCRGYFLEAGVGRRRGAPLATCLPGQLAALSAQTSLAGIPTNLEKLEQFLVRKLLLWPSGGPGRRHLNICERQMYYDHMPTLSSPSSASFLFKRPRIAASRSVIFFKKKN